MTRKDYILLVEVFNRKEIAKRDLTLEFPDEGYTRAYYFLLNRLIRAIKAANPRFNADEFIRNLDK